MTFKLTYSTMFNPPPELHAQFDAALVQVRAHLGSEHAMSIGGRDVRAPRQFAVKCPMDTRTVNNGTLRLVRHSSGSNVPVNLLVSDDGRHVRMTPQVSLNTGALTETFAFQCRTV